ncbi:sodium-dependent multivitamin transporter-like [Styela clava]
MEESKIHFSVWDYVVFALSLILSLAIGLRYAFTGGKQMTTSEFLMADRKMRYGPVALSLMVTFISAVSVLGVPAEIFVNGTDYCYLAVSYFLCFPIVCHIFIPVFYKLKITSVYEYLELRFSKSVRICGTVVYMLMLIIYMGVVLYTPALALNTVTDINVWISVVVLCAVCTVYTTLGGLKAVIWTDVFQATVMLGGQAIVLILGVVKVGGMDEVWRINTETGKLSSISFNPSPFERHTFWTLAIGGAFMCLSLYGTSQTAVQRYLSCETMKDAQITAYLNVPLLIIVMIINGLLGLTAYATYHCENPLATGAISKSDQLLIFYMLDVLNGYPGLPGIFVACLFSAALSTISSCFNALATLTMQDLVQPFVDLSDRKAVLYSKVLAFGYGIVCLLMAGIASTMGSVLIAAISIFGIIGGPLLGLFVLGMFFRIANTKGALIGFFTGLVFIFIVGFGSIFYFILEVPKPTYELRDETCNFTVTYDSNYTTESNLNISMNLYNITNTTQQTVIHEKPKLYEGFYSIFKLSYLWYSGISGLVVIIVGLIASWITSRCDETDNINERTLHPLVRRKQIKTNLSTAPLVENKNANDTGIHLNVLLGQENDDMKSVETQSFLEHS